MHRREFHKLLGLGAAAGLSLPSLLRAQPHSADPYRLPRFGNVHLMHMTDVHAQLLPVHYREPSVNIGVHDARNRPPHLVGQALLNHFDIAPGSQAAHALSHLDYVAAAEQFGRAGGFAHIATLVGGCGQIDRARCCLMAGTCGRALPRRCGRRARTWSRPASSWASMS